MTSVCKGMRLVFLAVHLSHAPDRLEPILLTRVRPAHVNINDKSSRFALGETPGYRVDLMTWLSDGDVLFSAGDDTGMRLYRISRRKPVQKQRSLPDAGAGNYSVAADGRHLIAVSSRDRPDFYMIRNFGEFLHH